jgi:hypothetical protein
MLQTRHIEAAIYFAATSFLEKTDHFPQKQRRETA